MKQPADPAREQAVEVRFGQVGILQVRLRTTRPGEILDELTGKTATAPHFFDRTPVCLDLSSLPKLPPPEEIRTVIDVVRRAGMMTIGVAAGGTGVEELANKLDLPVIHHVRASTKTAPVVQAAPGSNLAPASEAAAPPDASVATAEPAPTASSARAASLAQRASSARATSPAAASTLSSTARAATTSAPSATGHAATASAAPQVSVAAAVAARSAQAAAALTALLQTQPVRSGQRVYARARDLIVMATVAAGAEVMADGCVHVYGPLRGRVMAGAHGDTDARVFCQAFHAELVSIAGVFRVFETIPPELVGMPVQAWLAGDDLKFAKIGE